MEKYKSNIYLVTLILFVLIFLSCAQVKHYDYEAMKKARKNWKANRPKIKMTKKQIDEYFEINYNEIDPIEGIWLYSFSNELSSGSSNNPSNNAGMEDINKNVWKVAIIKDSTNPYAETYIEVLYEPLADNTGYSEEDIGTILGFFKSDLFPNNYIHELPMGPKEAYPDFFTKTVTIRDNIVYVKDKYKMKNNILYSKQDKQNSGLGLKLEYLYTKVPFTFEQNSKRDGALSDKMQIGSGTIISESGLIVTNYHIIKDSPVLSVFLPQINQEYNADLIIKDKNNDIAILKIQNFKYSDIFSNPIPFSIPKSTQPKLGEDVFTLGFPFGELLGKSPKFSSGKINSLFGIQDDPRIIQISNPIQPGNSGGPLFNSEGEFIGIVFSSLNAKFFYENADIIPQNVNFAVKSNYLLNLISMLPEDKAIKERDNLLMKLPIEKQVELIKPFIVNVKAK